MKRILIIMIAMGIAVTSLAQVKTADLRTPASPGFILMDETPASIERPTTPQGFALKLLNLREGGALEVAPYWLVSHPELTFERYAHNIVPIGQTTSLSLATASKSDTFHLSFGARTHLLKLRSISNKDEIKTLQSQIVAELSNVDPDPAKVKTLTEKLMKALVPTLLVEGAFAYLQRSETGSYSDLVKSRVGAWLNLAWHPLSSEPWEFIGLVRYLENPDFSEYAAGAKVWDFGVRANYKMDRVGISGEYVARSVKDGEKYDRLAGTLEYKLNDELYMTATFGQNFGTTENIIAMFGINFGFAKDTTLK